jgi:23S rRNA-/tRNA-specific pseudouridylate synthase
MRHEGYPLAVDLDYGGKAGLFLSELKPRYKAKKDRPEKPLVGRLSLHARRIALSHPITGERIEVEAPRPKDFEMALRNLRKFRKLVERAGPFPEPD